MSPRGEGKGAPREATGRDLWQPRLLRDVSQPDLQRIPSPDPSDLPHSLLSHWHRGLESRTCQITLGTASAVGKRAGNGHPSARRSSNSSNFATCTSSKDLAPRTFQPGAQIVAMSSPKRLVRPTVVRPTLRSGRRSRANGEETGIQPGGPGSWKAHLTSMKGVSRPESYPTNCLENSGLPTSKVGDPRTTIRRWHSWIARFQPGTVGAA
jgi:hypothetical protein